MDKCELYEECKERRVNYAEFTATVKEKLKNIEGDVKEIKDMVINNASVFNSDIKSLYFKVGVISGGVSLITSLATVMMMK